VQNIYILTNFSMYLKSYSPIIVVESQLKMFLRNGYQPTLIVSEGWEAPEGSIFSQVNTIKISSVAVSNDPDTFKDSDLDDIERLYQDLTAILPPECVVITHDLIFLPDYVKHNVAARHVASDQPGISWIHWIHSATSPHSLINERRMYGDEYARLLNEKFPNSVIVFPNAYSIPRVSANFGVEEDEVFEVPHPADLTEGMAPIVKRLFDAKKLGDVDVLMVYPLRLDRGKNAEVNIKTIAGLIRQGISAHLIFCDFQSTGDDKVVYRQDLRALAQSLGAEASVTFLSEFDDQAQLEVSHQVVLDLLTLSNVFMMPSKSETYSLVTQEAMMRGNFCILNHDFAPFRQIFGEGAIYRPFSANIGFDGMDGEIVTTFGNENDYFDRLAINIKYWLDHDKTIKAKTWVRKERNLDAVFKKYLEPLLERHNNE
jgi:glycosyltransferase involved in cell wall biosynthesis